MGVPLIEPLKSLNLEGWFELASSTIISYLSCALARVIQSYMTTDDAAYVYVLWLYIDLDSPMVGTIQPTPFLE